ncbi:AfsR/SARP family transcriptional regulator [Labedaea rhizosphaerae]|uniref:DNA-binding SARP family transcriptional activator n=1 Tax=Labedaea rhizosphaerae TaxID=598644 RepID=A0A4R6SF81_LABRH|nr:BTAD domain-containing putative transcriptional regulator [Labedaea rhizosphaerae]TDP97746.1 DNA-binding SARP family transcriptional activator [Labedaea rhizosphaerae]
MEFRLLGPLEVVRDGRRVSPGGPRQHRLLAALLLAVGRTVTVDALIDAVWDDTPPATARHQLHKAVAALRERLRCRIETEPAGYRLPVTADTLDLAAFEHHLASAKQAAAADHLAAAVALWRGPALDGVDGTRLRAAAHALDERRAGAVERLAALRLADGDTDGLADELATHLAEHPYREELRALVMKVLHHDGRQADALRVYHQGRTLLAEQLGVDPSAQLRALHQQILQGEVRGGEPGEAPLNALPHDIADFTGRTAELDWLRQAATPGAVIAVDGMPGVGKTTLAVRAAHRLAADYPGGRLFLDLRGHTPGATPMDATTALGLLLRMLGVAPAAIPSEPEHRAARWRSELAGRRVLVVLDNAAGAAQVRPLLPAAPGCLTIVTARRRLGALDGAATLTVDIMPALDARRLFESVAGPGRVAAEPDAVVESVARCGQLPLAVRIAATRLAHRPAWTVGHLAGRLRDEHHRLAELAVDDRTVAAAFALSYKQLPDDTARLFRLLGVHPGLDIDVFAAAALAGAPVRATEKLLQDMVDVHLVTEHVPGRYGMHDLLRQHARRLAHEVGEPGSALDRLVDYYLAAATVAADQLDSGRRFTPAVDHQPAAVPELTTRGQAQAWFGAELANLVEAVEQAKPSQAWQLGCVVRPWLEQRGLLTEWARTHHRALDAARACGDRAGAAVALCGLGALHLWCGEQTLARQCFHDVLDAEANAALRVNALTNLGILALRAGDYRAAIDWSERALAITGRHGEHGARERRDAAATRTTIGLALGRLGDPERALREHRSAITMARQAGAVATTCQAVLGLAETAYALGDLACAAANFREALDTANANGLRFHQAIALEGLAHACAEADPQSASARWAAAARILGELGSSYEAQPLAHLDSPDADCDLCRGVPVRTA